MEFIVKNVVNRKLQLKWTNYKESESNFRQTELGFSFWGVLFVFQRKQRSYVNRTVQNITVFASSLKDDDETKKQESVQLQTWLCTQT